jgi:transposase
MVEFAWGGLYWQPDSHLSRWYQERCGQGRGCLRKLGSVALARKLLVALWRLVAHGEIPPGAARADWYRKVTGRCAKRRVGVAMLAG